MESHITQTVRATQQDRIVGCIFGSALGDTIGLYTEHMIPAQALQEYPTRWFTLLPLSEPTPFARDPHRRKFHLRHWTDETDQALCILLSCLHSNGEFFPADLAERLNIWAEQGLRALDTMPLGAGRKLSELVTGSEYLDDPEEAATEYWVSEGFFPASNKSLTRTYPLGLLCIGKNITKTFNIAAAYSVITHVDPRCIVSCAIGTALVSGFASGQAFEERYIDDVIEEAVDWYDIYRMQQEDEDPAASEYPDLDREELDRHVVANRLDDLQLDQYGKISYVYKTLGSGILLLRLALRSIARADGKLSAQLPLFRQLITDLAMCGGDADANCCFAGALLGSLLGFKALPLHWRGGLQHRDWLMGKAESLCQMLGVVDGHYDGANDMDRAIDGGRGLLTPKQIAHRRFSHLEATERLRKRHEAVLRRSQACSRKKGDGNIAPNGAASV
ncbi:Uu.00g006970.m01.CDS01 [Anthostomella pinea]|uniref:Uu.00g006970.m01.CDS01 n=1 Tax=Anthostomella pinea TaxID=933095 RepID=A0AAI8VL44_9PEZI|nr:Uu.00g006970.m01.CDS01 [Anthostomella pinea]